MARFRVRPNGSILAPDSVTLWGPGTILDGSDIKDFEALLRDGFIEPADIPAGQGDLLRVPGASGVIMPGEVDLTKREKPIKVEKAAESAPKVQLHSTAPVPPLADPDSAIVRPAVPSQISPWSLDPALLVGKSLTELNVMVAERDQTDKIEPFTTIPEVVAFLSQDFNKTK